jgi:hypothetical protein
VVTGQSLSDAIAEFAAQWLRFAESVRAAAEGAGHVLTGPHGWRVCSCTWREDHVAPDPDEADLGFAHLVEACEAAGAFDDAPDDPMVG